MCSAGALRRSPSFWNQRSRRSTARCSAHGARSTSIWPRRRGRQRVWPSASCSTVTWPAFEYADMDGLVALLREDATLRMPPQPSLSGGLQIARFFLHTVAQGDLTRIRHRPTRANGRPAVTIEARADDGTWIPHGIAVLEIEAGQIAGIDAFLDPELAARFGSPARG